MTTVNHTEHPYLILSGKGYWTGRSWSACVCNAKMYSSIERASAACVKLDVDRCPGLTIVCVMLTLPMLPLDAAMMAEETETADESECPERETTPALEVAPAECYHCGETDHDYLSCPYENRPMSDETPILEVVSDPGHEDMIF